MGCKAHDSDASAFARTHFLTIEHSAAVGQGDEENPNGKQGQLQAQHSGLFKPIPHSSIGLLARRYWGKPVVEVLRVFVVKNPEM